MVSPGSSFGGNSLQLEIGLGKAEKINSAKIFWPEKGKAPQILESLELNKVYTVKEGQEAKLIDYISIPFQKDGMHMKHSH
jgi:hypothetical protein